jgi:hopanoid biosynthesis associated RND transporter like protein HpnN
MKTAIALIVELSRRHAPAVVTALFLLALFGGSYVARHIAIDSDTGKLVDPKLPWQKASADLARQFPQNEHLLVTVVDAKTPDSSADAAAEIADRLAAEPSLFSDVRRPDANPYFRRYGMLFLPVAEVQSLADHIIAAQPFLGTLASDPSPRGVVDAIDLLALGGIHGAVDPARIDPALSAVADAAEAAAGGQRRPLAWEALLSGRRQSPSALRHFILARAALNYGQVEAGSQAIAGIHAAALAAGLGAGSGVTVRVTGPVALDNDQLAVLSEGATFSTALCLCLLLFWLALGLRSMRTMLAVLGTLAVGLVGCAAFAVRFIGPFNPVSIAFAPLFVGIAIDFGIQFSVRYTAERISDAPAGAFRQTALGVGPPLTVAALATASGFLAFVPTEYLGVRDLGLIAGVGMILALALNLTLLPALLALLAPKADAHSAGFPGGARADQFLVRRRGAVLVLAVILAVAGGVSLTRLKLDFNPVDLENPNTESVRTLFDLLSDPDSSPYTIEFLVPPAEAAAAAARLQALPEVARVLSLASFVPGDQQPKLDLLSDAASLLGPTLSPSVVKAPPSPAEVAAALNKCAGDLAQMGSGGDAAAARLAKVFRTLAAQGAAAMAGLEANLSAGILRRLDDLREILQAGPVSLESIPPGFRRDWVAPDGRWRVEVFPKGNTRDNVVLVQFSRAVRAVVPAAVGSAVEVDEWTRLAPRAFATAGALALAAIAVLLLAVLRRARDVALVLAPLLLAGILTLGTAALLGFSINFANIITLPMLLGIGVAFDIYFVMRWRAGEAGLLGSPTARGIVFSALTTGSAFGSLALSRSPGMAEMGKFLSLALFFVLFCTLLILPALFGARSGSAADVKK